MHTLERLALWKWCVLGLGVRCAMGAVVPAPTITTAPIVERQDPNAIELANVVLTAIPASLRQLAATNLPAVSSILWHEFLDNNKPEWFKNLPENIQSYLIVQYGPSTAWPTASPTLSVSSAAITTSSSELLPTTTASSTFRPDSPPASSSGLTQGQKIGIGIGIPLGFLAFAAILIPCCFACHKKRKEKKKNSNGYEPPPSPGFVPHGAFQEKSTSYQEYSTPLRPSLNRSQSWDHDEEPWVLRESQDRVQDYVPATSIGNTTTVMGPPLVHTHSSNRARGQRTGHPSLHSVTELTEPIDEYTAFASRKPTLNRSSMPLQIQDIPPIPTTVSIRGQSIPQTESSVITPTPEHASGHFSLLRSTILHQDHSSSSSNLAPTTSSPEDSRRSSDITNVTTPSSSSPNYMNQRYSSNPFSTEHSYVEDYDPEYQNEYVDVDDGLYGGHRSLNTYPPVPEKSERRGSKGMTDWPLRNVDWPLRSLGSRRLRDKNPEWDPVHER